MSRCGVEVVITGNRPPPRGFRTVKRRNTPAASSPVLSFTLRIRPLTGALMVRWTPEALEDPSPVFQNSASAWKTPGTVRSAAGFRLLPQRTILASAGAAAARRATHTDRPASRETTG